MRTAMAYFAGAGTVIAAIGIGLGGGLTIANVMSPHQEKLEQTRLDQRMSAKPIPQSAQADQAKQQAEAKPAVPDAKPAVPYVAATSAAITANGPAEKSPSQTQAAPASQPSPQPAEAKLAKEEPAKPAEAQTAKPQAAPHEQAAVSSEDTKAKPLSAQDANATARDSDLKRLAAEKRKAQRRQQWAERKKAQQHQQRDAELREGDTNARRDGDRPLVRGNDGPRIVVQQDDGDFDRPREVERRSRADSDRSDRPFGFPGFNLFGGDRDD